MNTLIHKLIFGYTLVCPLPDDGWKMQDNKGNPHYGVLPDYTTDIDDALSIAYKLTEDGDWGFNLEYDPSDGTFAGTFDKKGYSLAAHNHNPAEAIAKASLMAVRNGWVNTWQKN